MIKIKVKKVLDGDTFQAMNGKFYRLAGFDTPEKRKLGYQKAKDALNDLIAREELIINEVGKSYTRIVVEARKPGEKMSISTKMKRKGYK